MNPAALFGYRASMGGSLSKVVVQAEAASSCENAAPSIRNVSCRIETLSGESRLSYVFSVGVAEGC